MGGCLLARTWNLQICGLDTMFTKSWLWTFTALQREKHADHLGALTKSDHVSMRTQVGPVKSEYGQSEFPDNSMFKLEMLGSIVNCVAPCFTPKKFRKRQLLKIAWAAQKPHFQGGGVPAMDRQTDHQTTRRHRRMTSRVAPCEQQGTTKN